MSPSRSEGMGSAIFEAPALWLLAVLFLLSPARLSGLVMDGTATVDGAEAIAATDEHFVCAGLDWWPSDKCDYGSCSWGNASLLSLNLSNPIFLNAIKAFSPLKLRLGGSLQDKLIYETGDPGQSCRPFVKNDSEIFNFTQGCLPIKRWDQLNEFFHKTGAIVIFGLNALNGRVQMRDGSLGGPWNYTNAESLIRYSVDKGYNISGWELGNELSGTGIGYRIRATRYAADVISLKSLVDQIYQGNVVKPLVLAPGAHYFDKRWFSKLINKTKASSSLDVLTLHLYNLGPSNDSHLVDKILDPSYLDKEALVFSNLSALVKNSGTSVTAWIGEAGGAYNSGRRFVSDSFVDSFWYLDQLGMSSKYDIKTYCRQSLIGGHYGLLNSFSYKPNPDYYSALLWHRLMGPKVLSVSFKGTNKIRAYAQCARQSKGITLLLINLDLASTSLVQVTAMNSHPGVLKQHRAVPEKQMREEYHLTPKDGDLHSQIMLLNGKILDLGSNGEIPALKPVQVYSLEPINVSPLSIVFAHIPYFYAHACN